MDAFLVFIKKYPLPSLLIALLLPLGIGLLYSGGKSFWVSRRNKQEKAAILDFMIKSNAYDKALTNDEIAKGTGIPRERVIHHCANHDDIEDAGKRQRSWKLIKE